MISRCAFITASGAVDMLKKLFLVARCLVISVRRSSCRPVRNSGSRFKIPCNSEMAYPKLRNSIAATALSQWLCCVSVSSFSVLTAIPNLFYHFVFRGEVARRRSLATAGEVGGGIPCCQSRSNCGLSDFILLVAGLLFALTGVSVPLFGLSRCERMSFARSRIAFGKPARRATWIP